MTAQNSSVARLRPEYLLRPLLPTQLMQTLYATLGQILVASYVAHCRKQAALENNGEPILRVGTVCVIALSIYSVGRLLFFAIREDENFKSNKSYTTAYMALGTLAGQATAAAIILFSPPSPPIASPSSLPPPPQSCLPSLPPLQSLQSLPPLPHSQLHLSKPSCRLLPRIFLNSASFPLRLRRCPMLLSARCPRLAHWPPHHLDCWLPSPSSLAQLSHPCLCHFHCQLYRTRSPPSRQGWGISRDQGSHGALSPLPLLP